MKKMKSILASTIVASVFVMNNITSEAQTGTSVPHVMSEKILPFKVNFPKRELDQSRPTRRST